MPQLATRPVHSGWDQAKPAAGWQIYFTCDDDVVACVGESGYITKRLDAVMTWTLYKPSFCESHGRSLLDGPHPLDHIGKVDVSVVWHDPQGVDDEPSE